MIIGENMKKGFTLVEVLAVITIIGVLALIVVPGVDSILKSNRDKLYESQINSIVEATKSATPYLASEIPEEDGGYLDVTLGYLKYMDLIDVEVKDPRNDSCISNNTVVRITRINNSFKYTLLKDNYTYDSSSCSESSLRQYIPGVIGIKQDD